MKFIPSYISLYKTGKLKERVQKAQSLLENCSCCPNNCRINRLNNKVGVCNSRFYPIISAYTPHFGEEPLISGTKGAGNIFFGNCNLKCIFCQNHEISQNKGTEFNNEQSFERLADIMLELQNGGCHNIGLVSPTHFVPQILISLEIAIEKGLNIPLVYNSNGYDSVAMLSLLDGIIDIYLPDFKYGSNDNSFLYSSAKDYFNYATNAIREMYRQVGHQLCISDGILTKGLIIRHLVLPNDLAETELFFNFLSKELNNEITVSIMSQYFPTHIAINEPLLSRTISEREYEKVINMLELYNLSNGWIQEYDSHENYRPNFNKSPNNPFLNKL